MPVRGSFDATLGFGVTRIRVVAEPSLSAEVARTVEAMGFIEVTGEAADPVVRLERTADPPALPPEASLRIQAHPLARGYQTDTGVMLWTPAGRSVVTAGRADVLLTDGSVPSDVTWHLTVALQLLARSAGAYALHAAALVSPGGAALLLVGPSNAGKSTLAYTLVREGWSFVSDDSVLLCATSDGDVEVRPFRRRFGLDADGPFPDVATHAVRQPAEVAKWSVDVASMHAGRARARATPQLLVFPEIADAPESRLAPILPIEAYSRLLAEVGTRRLDDAHTPAHHARLGKLLAQAPAIRLLAGLDVLDMPHRVADLVARSLPLRP